MSTDTPSPREHELLVLIHRHTSDFGEPPSPGQLVDEFGFKLNYILTLIGRLIKKGFLQKQQGRPILTDKAEKHLSGLRKPLRRLSVTPSQVRLIGTVQAGKTDPDEAEIDENLDDTILVPETRLEKNTFAYRVEGTSMEHEHVFKGDYIIVEAIGNEWPTNGEMIVTKYCPLESENNDPDSEVPVSDYSKPAVKIYSEERDKKTGELLFYRLGWKKGNSQNPNLIQASRIKPIGRVIAVYRDLKDKKLNT